MRWVVEVMRRKRLVDSGDVRRKRWVDSDDVRRKRWWIEVM